MARDQQGLRTPRLTGRAVERGDWPFIAALLADPRMARWLRRDGAATADPLAAQAVARGFAEAWSAAGVGPYLWTIGPKAAAYAGLRPSRLESAAGWEAVVAVAPEFQRRGYGLEALGAALEAFGPPEPSTPIWAWTLPENHASRALLQKLGFAPSHGAHWATLEHVVYRRLSPEPRP